MHYFSEKLNIGNILGMLGWLKGIIEINFIFFCVANGTFRIDEARVSVTAAQVLGWMAPNPVQHPLLSSHAPS